MADNLECLTCGGTDFYKEAGYFYCNECQTQSQEVREHAFQDQPVNVDRKNVTKIKQPTASKVENNITSWECYNIIMSCLTQQLISLGADKNLQPVVKCLWMKYLEKLEVFHLNHDVQPKLPLVNCKMDASILFGITKKKKRKRRKSSDESCSSHPRSLKRERSKKKRALAQAQYEEFSQKSTQDESTSLHNETLSSLKGSSEKSVKSKTSVSFSRYSIQELRNQISKYHYQKHKLDPAQNLNCHKLTYKNRSYKYKGGVHFISPIKLYCILYLGLLISKDNIQLGDLLRFVREGHLSFNNFTPLFPEDYANKFLNIRNNIKNKMFCTKAFRETATKLAQFLNITTYIQVPNLTELCRRYCTEMNLPDEVFVAAKNILSKTTPKLKYTKKDTTVPNYEGRVMSIIMFVLKLLFGMDDVTEYQLSKYAQLVNKVKIEKPIMFDITKWLKYITYRNLIIAEHHFPSNYLKYSEINSDQFLHYIKSQNIQFDESIHLTKEMKDYKELLTKIGDLQNNFSECVEFPSSLTPFLTYSDTLLKLKSSKCLENVLKESFIDTSLDFLLRPNKYLELLNTQVEIKHCGANDNWVMEDIKTYRSIKNVTDLNHHLIPVEITNRDERHIDKIITKKSKKLGIKFDPQYVQMTYGECRQHIFNENEHYTKNLSENVKLNSAKIKNKNGHYRTHYNPHERYWLNLHMNIDLISKNDVEKLLHKYPNTFKIIFQECTRIIEQNEQEFFQEYQFTEIFLVYSAVYSKDEKRKSKKLLDPRLNFYVSQAEAHW